jgi:hypothetical protein
MLSGKEFFLKTFDEGYEGDVEQVDTDIPEVPIVPEVEVPTEVETDVEVILEVEKSVDKFNIDGEEFTVDQIKEWKQNGLRQADYTKKTQELAEQRKALKVEIPEVDETSPNERLQKIERDIATKELDLEITNFKIKYPDFDEIAVLTEAEKRGIYDLDFIYKALRTEVPSAQLDIEALKAKAIEDYKNEIVVKKQINKDLTGDSIVSSVPGKVAIDYEGELSFSELEFCKRRGWTPEQYVKDKNNTYKL